MAAGCIKNISQRNLTHRPKQMSLFHKIYNVLDYIIFMIIGCDEAGRGPVLGSMFVTAVKTSESNVPQFADDSKKFTNNQIFRMYNKIEEQNIEFHTTEIKSTEIDGSKSLNELSTDSYRNSINDLYDPGDDIFIDCYSNNKSEIQSIFKNNFESSNVLVEFSADEKYNIVGLASIISKAKREIHIDNISDNYECDIGSGYPSDPKTRRFLKHYIRENQKLPACARESWNTCSKIMDKVL